MYLWRWTHLVCLTLSSFSKDAKSILLQEPFLSWTKLIVRVSSNMSTEKPIDATLSCEY